MNSWKFLGIPRNVVKAPIGSKGTPNNRMWSNEDWWMQQTTGAHVEVPSWKCVWNVFDLQNLKSNKPWWFESSKVLKHASLKRWNERKAYTFELSTCSQVCQLEDMWQKHAHTFQAFGLSHKLWETFKMSNFNTVKLWTFDTVRLCLPAIPTHLRTFRFRTGAAHAQSMHRAQRSLMLQCFAGILKN